MKALKVSELDIVLQTCQWLEGTFLQEVLVSNRDVALFFFKEGGGQWLVIDFLPQAPSLWLLERVPFSIKKQTTPVQLFLQSHFKGKRLQKIFRNTEMGRVVVLEFAGENKLSMELRLIPHGYNLILQSGKKKLALKKPKQMEGFLKSETIESEFKEYQPLLKSWIASRSKKVGENPSKNHRKKQMKKVEKAISKVRDAIERAENSQWKQAGDFLVQSQSLEKAKSIYPDWIDESLSLADNVETCFTVRKKIQLKQQGTKQRLIQMQEELKQLQEMTDDEYIKNKQTLSKEKVSKKKPIKGLKTRKTSIGEDLELFTGKTAKDNLALLRKARAWDCWFHLEDFPSAHGVLFRNKKRELTDMELQKAARFLAETHAEKNKNIQPGEVLAVIWTEVRHVRPIKGDKIGRVTHKNTQSLKVKL